MIPFVKWAGGKRQLIDEINKRLPDNFNRYYEPFVGAGAVFLELGREGSVINDFNEQLINVYKQIKRRSKMLMAKLDRLADRYNALETKEDKAAMYYEIRDKFNEGIAGKCQNMQQAAYFIFLNKCCFNGLYRVNSNGYFNVPFGQKNKVNLYDRENIEKIAELLKTTLIYNLDFEKACRNVKEGDFVFFDSPYYDTYDLYQKCGFSQEDHIRLAKLFKTLTEKGAYCMLTNSDAAFIKELYKDFNIEEVEVKRLINRDANNRKGREVIVTNYVKEL